MGIPLEVRVEFQAEMLLTAPYSFGSDPPEMHYNVGLAGADNNISSMSQGWNAFGKSTAKLKPGVPYTLTIFAEEDLADYRVSFAPVDGYRLMLEGSNAQRISGNAGSASFYYAAYDVWLEPQEPAGTFGMGESVDGGGRIFWRVAMGELKNGSSAGRIEIREGDFSGALFTPGVLRYHLHSSDVEIIRSGSALRQVKAPGGLADIVTVNSTSYDIEFYSLSQVGAKSGGLYTAAGSPFVRYRVEKYAGSSTKLRILKHVGAKTWETRLEKSGDAWTLFDWRESGQSHLRKKTWVFDADGYPTIEVRDGSGALVSRSREEYGTNWYGPLMDKETFGYGSSNLTSEYEYSSGRLKSMARPDGSWVKYDRYTDLERRGLVSKMYEPYEDAPASPPSGTTTSGKVRHYTYADDWTGMTVMPSLVETKINDVTAGKTAFDYSFTQTVSAHGKTLPLVVVTRKEYDGASSYVATVTKSFRPDADPSDRFFPGLTHSVTNPDGTKISRAYLNGFYLPAYQSFTPDASGPERVEYAYTGTSVSSQGNLLGSVGVSGHAYDIDDLYLVPNQSTMTRVIRGANGKVVNESDYLYDGSGWVLMRGSHEARDALGNLDKTTEYYAASTTTGVTYATVYDAAYQDGLKLSELDELGAETTFSLHDAMGRPTKETSKGNGTSVPDVVTYYEYDAEGRVAKTKVGASSQIVSTSSYDYAGRVTRETAPGPAGSVIDIDYTYPGNRSVRRTFPDGGYVEEDFFLDGRLKKVAGSAAVPKHVDYSVDSAGVETEKTALNATFTDGWIERSLDWLERPRSEKAPAYSGTSETRWHYSASTGQLVKKTFMSGSTKLAADVLYVYGALGKLTQEGMDIDESGSLAAASNDRIKLHTSDYVLDGGAWYSRLKTETHPHAGSSTKLSLGETREQVTHLSSAHRGRTRTIDANGNATTATLTANLATRELTETIDYPGVSNDATSRALNGLPVHAKSKEGVETDFQYDAWGRLTKESGRADVETRYEYYSGTDLVYRTLNKHVETGRFEYDASGRVKLEKRQDVDLAWREVRYAYNQRGQLTRRWGSAAMPVENAYNSYGWRAQMKTFRGGGGWDGATWPGGTADATTWAYQGATGLVTSKTDAAGTRTFHYRASDLQLEREELPYGFYGGASSSDMASVTRTYQASGLAGRYDGLQYGRKHSPAQHYHAAYGYDGATGRLSTLSAHGQTFAYSYLSGSNLVSSVSSGSFRRDQYWQNWRDIADTVDNKWGSASRAKFTYDYDWLERRVGEKLQGTVASTHGYGHGRRYDWQYNLRGELDYADAFLLDSSGNPTSAPVPGRHESYAFDNARNRTLQDLGGSSFSSFQTNSLNQYSLFSDGQGLSAAYDDDGNLAFDGQWVYAYDAANRLKSATNNWTWATYEFKYDYRGRMVSRKAPELVNGLRAQYWNSLTWTNFKGTALSAQVDRNWGSGAPVEVSGMSPDQFIARWVGYIEAPADGTYTLYVEADDGASLYVDGKLAISDWNDGHDEKSASAFLRRGAKTPIVLNYYENAGSALARLKWEGPGIPKQVAPSASLWTESLAAPAERRFVYDGWSVVAEVDGGGSLLETHLWGLDVSGSVGGAGGIGGLLLTRQSGANFLALQDGMGNVAGMLSSSGSVVAAYDYSGFGEAASAAGSKRDDFRFGYANKRAERAMNLVNFGMRFYDPRHGRFINRDPIAEAGGANLYAFLGNDGINSHERLGMGFFKKLFRGFKKAGKALKKVLKGAKDVVIQVALGYVPVVGPYLSAAYGGYRGQKSGGLLGAAKGAMGGYRVGAGGWQRLGGTQGVYDVLRNAGYAGPIGEAVRHDTQAVRALDRRIRGYGRGETVHDSLIFLNRDGARPSFREQFGDFFERFRNSIMLSAQLQAIREAMDGEEARSKEATKALKRTQKAWKRFAKKNPAQAQEFIDAARDAGVTFNAYLHWNVNYSDQNSSMSGTSKIGGTYRSSSKEFNLNVDRSMAELVEAIRHEGTHLVDDVVHGMNITNTPRDVLEQRAYGPSYTPGQDLSPGDTIQRLNNKYPGSNWQKSIDRGPGGSFTIDDIIGGP